MATHEDFATQLLELHVFVQAGSAMIVLHILMP